MRLHISLRQTCTGLLVNFEVRLLAVFGAICHAMAFQALFERWLVGVFGCFGFVAFTAAVGVVVIAWLVVFVFTGIFGA